MLHLGDLENVLQTGYIVVLGLLSWGSCFGFTSLSRTTDTPGAYIVACLSDCLRPRWKCQNVVAEMEEDKKDSVLAHREDAGVQVKAVQNVAFADANQKQQPSLLTRRMFMVC